MSPSPSQTAEVTATAAVDEFFVRFGCPLQIFTDQGRNFESKLFTAVCDLLEIHKARTTPYRPSANGQVERYNRTLMDAVRCYIEKAQDCWDEHLAQIAGALRSAVNRNSGFTANKLMLGREVNTDIETYVRDLEDKILTAHETARRRLHTSEERMKRDYDIKAATRPFEEGDIVYVLDTATVKGKCRKLSPSWKGPGIIVKKLTPPPVPSKDQVGSHGGNHDRLKKCVDRDIPQWLIRFRENLENSGSAKQETGSDLASGPPAGAAGARKLPESLDSTPRQQPRRGRPPKRSPAARGPPEVLPCPPDVGGVPVTDLT